jgi:phage replication-related protein YjqB (UPF0714/DUF867 family)
MDEEGFHTPRNLFFCEKADLKLLDEKTLKLFIHAYSEKQIFVGGTKKFKQFFN